MRRRFLYFRIYFRHVRTLHRRFPCSFRLYVSSKAYKLRQHENGRAMSAHCAAYGFGRDWSMSILMQLRVQAQKLRRKSLRGQSLESTKVVLEHGLELAAC